MVGASAVREFKIPNFTDIPPLKTAVMEYVPTGPGPCDSLAIGNLGNVPTAAANAVVDACGVRITDLKMDEMEAERYDLTFFLHSTLHSV